MSNLNIAFATHLSEIINHFRSILRALPPGATVVDCAPAGSAESMRIRELAVQEGCAVRHMDDMPSDGPAFDVLVTIHMQVAPWKGANTVPGVLGWAKRHARLCYGLGKTAWNLSDWNHFYDLILCFGPYQQKMFRHVFPGIEVRTVGYPRFDTFDPQSADRAARILELGGDPAKKCVIWLPTYSTLSSIPAYSERIAALAKTFNVFVKVHPGTPWLESERMALLRQQGFTALMAGDFDNVRLFELADYVLADYGGSAFGAIYTDRNLLLLNAPGDLFAEDTGWLSADIQLRDDFISVNPKDYIDIQRLLEDEAIWREQASIRATYRTLLFSAPPGQCGTAAAGFLLDLAIGAIMAPDRTLQPRLLPEVLAQIRKRPQEGYRYPWKGTYEWAKNAFKTLNGDLKREQGENTAARAAIRSLETEVGTLKTAHTALRAQLECAQEEMVQIRTESLRTAEALRALEKEHEALRAAHSAQEEELSQARNQHVSHFQTLIEELSTLRGEHSALQEAHSAQSEELLRSQAALRVLEGEHSALQEAHSAQGEELLRSQAALQALEGEHSALQEAHSAQSEELLRSQAALRALEGEHSALQEAHSLQQNELYHLNLRSEVRVGKKMRGITGAIWQSVSKR